MSELDFSVDLMRALLWQYNDAEKLQSIIQQKQDWHTENMEQFWVNWFRDVFDPRTANDFGLTVWSIILDVPILVRNEEPPPDDIPFGMDESDGNFENSNYRRALGGVQELTVEQARLVIFMRYHQITTDGSVVDANRFYRNFLDGQIYVIDNLDMTVDYIINFQPTARLRYVLENYDILPRPAGVKVRTLTVVPKIPFGFDLVNNNFDNGNFIGEE